MFRTAGPLDVDALYRFEILCFQQHRFHRDHVEWILRNGRAVTFLEDGPDGLRAAMMLLFERHSCRVLSVAVAPDARRQGIGTRLMQASEALCREKGVDSIRLEVSTNNLGAIEFYRRLGYRTDGVLYGYYSWGEDAYSMHKALVSTPTAKAPRRWRLARYAT